VTTVLIEHYRPAAFMVDCLKSELTVEA